MDKDEKEEGDVGENRVIVCREIIFIKLSFYPR